MAKAVVLNKANDLKIRNIELNLIVGPRDVKIAIAVVGICGSDVQYYKTGRIGPFTVDKPMILGHEASGVVIECGAEITDLKIGDRVCIEPGIPDFSSYISRRGLYNIDPSLTFWATPPIHGCLTHEVVHPANLVYKLADDMSFEEGAMMEPLSVALQATSKVNIQAGNTALVLGAGSIGILTALTALISGCSKVFIFDPVVEKIKIATQYKGVHALLAEADLVSQVMAETKNRGVDFVFECSGALKAYQNIGDYLIPGGTIVCVGMPSDLVQIDIVALQLKEVTILSSFRYANVYEEAVSLVAQKKINLTPLITTVFEFNKSVAAFERAAKNLAKDIKIMIKVSDS